MQASASLPRSGCLSAFQSIPSNQVPSLSDQNQSTRSRLTHSETGQKHPLLPCDYSHFSTALSQIPLCGYTCLSPVREGWDFAAQIGTLQHRGLDACVIAGEIGISQTEENSHRKGKRRFTGRGKTHSTGKRRFQPPYDRSSRRTFSPVVVLSLHFTRNNALPQPLSGRQPVGRPLPAYQERRGNDHQRHR
jgi:hypothetical protein